ncbi:hypothetical protein [Caviibacterium pharyngocola]|uniref:Uncharacterized protein n=1 Tax=Caviibacterium pharyngocola TaxID=28159 RepID=A0A2M8RSX0_9PAST|nr:hypothetical protein [Caviibacterium pharyngocola]PJG81976.1 hypothetical protein CVP04_11385 [Caviibacterium pharyngocola]
MKKWLLLYLLFPFMAVAQETGESCSQITDNDKRLECYDSVFIKQDNDTNKSKEIDSQLAKLMSWEYRETKDEMRETTNYFASILSSNKVEFSFPYQGGSHLYMTLRKHSELGNDVMFIISKGQFSCRINGCKISVKFDNNKVENYTMSEPDSGGSDTLFISSSQDIKKFTDKLRKSKKVIVELPFYEHGKKQFTFDIEGLTWSHF